MMMKMNIHLKCIKDQLVAPKVFSHLLQKKSHKTMIMIVIIIDNYITILYIDISIYILNQKSSYN